MNPPQVYMCTSFNFYSVDSVPDFPVYQILLPSSFDLAVVNIFIYDGQS